MGKYLIEGGRKLEGKVHCQSAKNAVLPMMAAAVMTQEEVVIRNCPKISDVLDMSEILISLGAQVRFCGNDLIIKADFLTSYIIPHKQAKKIRTSALLLGALLSRAGKAVTSSPGGCDLGGRPLDYHFYALRSLGARIDVSDQNIIACSVKRRGAEIILPYPSVGATENALLYSVTAKGITRIRNAAREPEIKDFCKMLNSMGACVGGIGESVITVYGVKRLHGTVYTPIGDRIEAGTYAVAAAITGGDLEIYGVKPENISPLLGKLCNNTCNIIIKNDIIHITSIGRGNALSVRTGPYPEFPTDLQAILTPLVCLSVGQSVIEDAVFSDRFSHINQLVAMGAKVSLLGNTAYVTGVEHLHGTRVYACDLRCGAALVIAGLAAKGKTTVENAYYIERGYSGFDEKLCALGAQVVKED